VDASQVPRAVAAGRGAAAACDLPVDDAMVLHDSNRIALRLRPCEVLARVAPRDRRAGAEFEVQMAQRLAATAAPSARLDPRVEPRVYDEGDFAVTFWTYHHPVTPSMLTPDEYAMALSELHSGLRDTDVSGLAVPHFLDRVAEAQRLIDDPTNNPAIAGDDRELLSATLRASRRTIVDRQAPEQLLHGEPHPGNLLRTRRGVLFIDLETSCRGPVEFDIAHASIEGTGPPMDVAAHYPGADEVLVRECWTLMLAMIVAWRCEPGDDLPDGAARAENWIRQLRVALDA
jgi:hypothetical protein